MTLAAFSNPFRAIARLLDAAANESRPAYLDRVSAFETFDAYYHNRVYDPLSLGGLREQINATLGNASASDLGGLYNPVAEVVDIYQHVYGGTFRASADPSAEDAPTDIRAVPGRLANAAALLPAVDLLWQWSNLSLAKQQLCRLAATHGTVGLRIVAEDHPDAARRRVYLKPEHPRIIRDVELDARGNVIAIELEYDHTYGLGDDQETMTIREVLTKAEIRTYVVVNSQLRPYDLMAMQENGPLSRYPNRLGVVPYVLLQHQSTGEAFGLNAFYRARAPIDRLNALLTHLNTQIHDHVKVDWFIAASGPAPTRIVLDGRSVVYTDTSRGAGQPPVVEPMVAPLNLADAIEQAKLLIVLIENKLPELKALSGTYLAGQSGETVAQLRLPAEHRITLARANYDDALVRASQIGLSWGILLDLWNLGTGQGSAEAAERAYREGLEDFTLNERAALPPVATPSAPAAPATTPTAAPAAAPVDSQENATPSTEDDDVS